MPAYGYSRDDLRQWTQTGVDPHRRAEDHHGFANRPTLLVHNFLRGGSEQSPWIEETRRTYNAASQCVNFSKATNARLTLAARIKARVEETAQVDTSLHCSLLWHAMGEVEYFGIAHRWLCCDIGEAYEIEAKRD